MWADWVVGEDLSLYFMDPNMVEGGRPASSGLILALIPFMKVAAS